MGARLEEVEHFRQLIAFSSSVRPEWRQTENNRRAKFYSLTKLGKKALNKETEDWLRLSAAISHVVALTGS